MRFLLLALVAVAFAEEYGYGKKEYGGHQMGWHKGWHSGIDKSQYWSKYKGSDYMAKKAEYMKGKDWSQYKKPEYGSKDWSAKKAEYYKNKDWSQYKKPEMGSKDYMAKKAEWMKNKDWSQYKKPGYSGKDYMAKKAEWMKNKDMSQYKKPEHEKPGMGIEEYCKENEKPERVHVCVEAFKNSMMVCKKKTGEEAKQCWAAIKKKLSESGHKKAPEHPEHHHHKKEDPTEQLIMESCKKVSKDSAGFKKCVQAWNDAFGDCKKKKNKEDEKKCFSVLYAKLKGEDKKEDVAKQLSIYCKKVMPSSYEKCMAMWKKAFSKCKEMDKKDPTKAKQCIEMLEKKLYFKNKEKKPVPSAGKEEPVVEWCKKYEPKKYDECLAAWKKSFAACKSKKDKKAMEKCFEALKKKLAGKTNKAGKPVDPRLKGKKPGYDTWTPGAGRSGRSEGRGHHGDHGDHGTHGWNSSINGEHMHGTHGTHGSHGYHGDEYHLSQELQHATRVNVHHRDPREHAKQFEEHHHE